MPFDVSFVPAVGRPLPSSPTITVSSGLHQPPGLVVGSSAAHEDEASRQWARASNAALVSLSLACLPAARRSRVRRQTAVGAGAGHVQQAGSTGPCQEEAVLGASSRRLVLTSSGLSLLQPWSPAVAQAPDAGGARLAALTPETLASAKGKVCLITGATAGVGLEAARNLYRNGAEVYVCGRSAKTASAAVAEITGSGSSAAGAGSATPLELDLASFDSVRAFAARWKEEIKKPIDIFALNAGLALKTGLSVEEAPLSKDGYELTVATNHLGHFLLCNLLLDSLAPEARVVVTASSVHDPATGDPGSQATLGDLRGLGTKGPAGLMVDGGAYDSGKSYKDSKLCNVLFTLELARRLKASGSTVTANCLSPGLIPSKTFFRNQSPLFSDVFAFASRNVLKIAETTEFGGDTLTFMALDKSLEGKSGLFYSAIPPGAHVFVEKTPSPEALDEAKAKELWSRTAKVVAL